MKKFEIEYLPIEDIKPYKSNPKSHPPSQINKIARSVLKELNKKFYIKKDLLFAG